MTLIIIALNKNRSLEINRWAGFYYIIEGRERSERHAERSEAQPEPIGEGIGRDDKRLPRAGVRRSGLPQRAAVCMLKSGQL